MRPIMTSPWHQDPDLKSRFHPEHPNDLQVVVHDGEPRRTKLVPEMCWVTVTGVFGALRMPVAPPDAQMPLTPDKVTFTERPVYSAKLLNEPKNLKSVHQGETILFVHSPGLPCPLRVTEAYLNERKNWVVAACNKCGADQALDPMTVMAKTRFPDAPGGMVPVAFSAFCGCGGTQMLSMVESPKPKANGHNASTDAAGAAKPWWKFW